MLIKICGITRVEDALLAYHLGAWAIGFNLYSGSPRYVNLNKTQKIIEQLPKDVVRIAVCVDTDYESLKEISSRNYFHFIQSHDTKIEEYCNNLKIRFIKVFRLQNEKELPQLITYNNSTPILIDSYASHCFGGSGKLANLELARLAQTHRDIILAGGLSSENIARIFQFIRPSTIDICSSIETIPGKKCEQKMRKFFNTIKKIKEILL